MREGLRNPQWHFTTYPSEFTGLLKKLSSKRFKLNFSKLEKDGSLFEKRDKSHILPYGYTVEKMIPLKDRIEVQP